MRPHDMKHLAQLLPVALDDVEHLMMKEATYQGSWKRSGGRSAWFMLRRKIDRLLEMMKRPDEPHGWSIEDYLDAVETGRNGTGDVTVDASVAGYLAAAYSAENIFAMIRRDSSGSDGSVLAEIRDLRRYLLLVEAEMVSRGAIEEPEIKDCSNADLYSRVFNATTAERTVPRYDAADEFVRASVPKPPSREDATVLDGDARQPSFVEKQAFSGLSPWLLLKTEWGDASETAGERAALDLLYDEHGAGLMKLTPDLGEAQRFQLEMVVNSNASVASNLIKSALKCYVEVKDQKLHVLDIVRAPLDYRSAWPHLHREHNGFELGQMVDWQRKLYFYHAGETKWKIRDGLEAWVRESL